MTVELFANLAETTLASGYTSGGASITVSSASGFPTTGTFRVRLGNTGQTIYRVDSIAGAVFTGGAEFNDANASAGDTVKIVASQKVAERWLQSPESTESYAPSGVSGADRYGPLDQVVYPVTASFTWGNQGAASIDTTYGWTRLTCPSTTANIRRRGMSAPATPYQVDARIQYAQAAANNRYGGLFFRESGTSKLHLLQYILSTNSFEVVSFSNDTTFSGAVSSVVIVGSTIGTIKPFWLRLRDDGTNLKFTYSLDGKYYFTEVSLGRTSFMAGAPNEIGFWGNVDGSAGIFIADFTHWRVS